MMLIDELKEIIICIIYTPLIYVQIPLSINKMALESKLQEELVEQNVCAICRRTGEWAELVNIYVIMTYSNSYCYNNILYMKGEIQGCSGAVFVSLSISVIRRVDIMYVATLLRL